MVFRFMGYSEVYAIQIITVFVFLKNDLPFGLAPERKEHFQFKILNRLSKKKK